MIDRFTLAAYLDTLLDCANFKDYAPNGLQVEGKEPIGLICTAVTASAKAIRRAAELEADALIVHHGYFWRNESPVLTGMKRVRIAELLSNDINLFAYHLPLDCHLELGNNACLAKVLDLRTIHTHQVANITNLLWSGSLATPKTPAQLTQLLAKNLGHTPTHISAHTNKPINRIAWCSGAAQDYIEEAHALGVDAYLSGEVSERTFYQAEELGIHYFACGHHATERYGIQALGEHLVNQFKIKHQFIDSYNPI